MIVENSLFLILDLFQVFFPLGFEQTIDLNINSIIASLDVLNSNFAFVENWVVDLATKRYLYVLLRCRLHF